MFRNAWWKWTRGTDQVWKGGMGNTEKSLPAKGPKSRLSLFGFSAALHVSCHLWLGRREEGAADAVTPVMHRKM